MFNVAKIALASLTIMLSFLLFSHTAMADGFRCKNKLVMPGDTTGEVRRKCGAPLDELSLGQVEVNGKRVHMMRWTYDLGNGRFLRLLEFHNGKLISIEDGPRS